MVPFFDEWECFKFCLFRPLKCKQLFQNMIMVNPWLILKLRTFRSTTVSGRLNSPTIQSGMAPPQGFALSSFRSNRTVSILFSCAKISAAQAPDGPPPTTATLYFILSEEEVATLWPTVDRPVKAEGVKAVTETKPARAKANFILRLAAMAEKAQMANYKEVKSWTTKLENHDLRQESGSGFEGKQFDS